jgi:hypothetical protein
MQGFSNKCYHVIKDGVYEVRKVLEYLGVRKLTSRTSMWETH